MDGIESDALPVPAYLQGSAVGLAIARHDWSRTPLGAIKQWPETLKALLGTMLANPFPMVLAWGPELITLHNQAYCTLLGARNQVIGLAFPDVWPELRDDLGKMFERALGGETCHFERASFTLLRNGRPEEAIFDFSLSPVRDEAGTILGVFNVAREITHQVMAERREIAGRERLASLFEQAPGFMALMEGREHRIVLANPAFRRIVGDRDLVGKCVADALPDAVAQGYLDVLNRVYASAEAHVSSGAKYLAQPSPNEPVVEHYVDVVFQPVIDAQGQVTGVFLEGADVTERVRAAADLQSVVERTGEILESISDAFYAVDRDWRFTYVNRKAEQVWHRRRDDLLGKGLWDEFPQAIGTEAHHAHRRAAETRRVVRVEALSAVLDRWVDISIYPASDGGLSVYFRDTTETRQARARFRTLVETAPALIFATDQAGRNVFVNERYQAYTGLSFDALSGDGWQDIVHPDDRADAVAESLAGRSDPRSLERRLRLRRHDGSWRWFLSRTEPVVQFGPDPEFAWLGISIDIDEQVRGEERERLLSQEVDHRAKNLLAVVQSIVQLTRGDDPDLLKDAITGRIAAMARAHDLLAASRWQGVDLQQLIDEELAAFAGSGAALRTGGPTIHLGPAAAQSLGLVLHELSTNAAKYGSLSVATGTLEIRWSLTGGAAECLDFHWVERGGPKVRAPTTTGFGSALIRASVERQLGGRHSAMWTDLGLECQFQFPLDRLGAWQGPAAQALGRSPAPEVSSTRGLQGLSVLLVEDETLVAMQVETALREAGCHIIGPVATIREAVQLIQSAVPGAALVDINLGGDRSYPVADLLAARGVPFAFCTGYSGNLELPERFRHVALLEKPFTAVALVRMLSGLARDGDNR